MQTYNAHLELADQLANAEAAQLLTRLRGYQPVLAATARGRAELTITLPATDLPTASLRAHRLAGLPITRSTIETTPRPRPKPHPPHH